MQTTRPTAIQQIESLLRAIDVSDVDEQTLTNTTSGLRTCQRLIDAILIAIANRATDLHKRGQAGTAPEVLNSDGQVSGATAAKDAARAGIARQIPALGLALENGDISGEHLDHAARHTKNLTDEQQAHLDLEKLADAALASTPDEFNRKAKNLVDQAKNDWGLGRAIEDRKRSEISTWHDKATGMGRISAWLDPERFSQFRSLLDAETTALANDRKNDDVLVKKDKHLAADAFMSLIERGATNQTGVTRPVIHLHCDIDTATNGPHEHSTSETSEGFHVPPESLQRFLCDAVIQPVYFGRDGTVLNVGRRRSSALAGRRTSRLSAPGRRNASLGCIPRRTVRNGNTDYDNLVPLCSHHHHRVHDAHWQLKLLPDRQLKIFKPDGVYWRTAIPDRPTRVPLHPD